MNGLFNPWFWFCVLFPRPYPPEEETFPVWEMEFTEVYSTRIKSDKQDEEEAKEHCFDLFNVHNSQPVRIKFDTEIKRL